MRLEVLKMLADNGEALDLRTEERDGCLWGGRAGEEPIDLGRQCRDVNDLRRVLAHYPRGVTIDGAALETRPGPELARVTVLEPGRHNLEENQPRELVMEDGQEPGLRSGYFNAVIGGVCCYIREKVSKEEQSARTYLAGWDAEHEYRHHRALRAVRMVPHTEVLAEEINELAADDIYGVNIPKDSPLEARTQERRLRMIELTGAAEGMPDRYEGPVHFWPVQGIRGDADFYRGAPIQVTGRAVAIDQEDTDITDPEFLAVADALERSDTGLVLVTDEEGVVMGEQIDSGPVSLMITEVAAETGPGGRNLTPAESITLTLTLEDRETGTSDEVEIPARLHLRGEWEDELEGRVVPGETPHEELRNILVRALWTHDDEWGWDEKKYQHEMMTERMGHLATHLLGDPEGAMLADMEKRVNRIFPSVPVPDAALTATSADGRWTLTLNGAARSAAA